MSFSKAYIVVKKSLFINTLQVPPTKIQYKLSQCFQIAYIDKR